MKNTLIRSAESSAIKNINEFKGHLDIPYLTGLESGRSFIFVTKPLLFINPTKPNSANSNNDTLAYNNMCKDPFFSLFLNSEAINELDSLIVNQLSYDTSLTNSNFLKIFTNEFKGFNPIDLTMETSDAFETKQSYRMPLPTHSTASEASGSFSIPIRETNNIDVTKMINLWVKYIKYITDGTFNANPDMIASGDLDYMSSIYYFVLGEDGFNIKYWSKYTGCYPTAVPYAAFNHARGDYNKIELDIPFVYTSKEDMNPRILEDFNRVSLNDLRFETSYDSTVLDYEPIKESEILNINKLMTGVHKSTVLSEDRDPLIFFEAAKISSDDISATTGNFNLSFSKNTIDSNYYIQQFEYTSDETYGYKTNLENGDT